MKYLLKRVQRVKTLDIQDKLTFTGSKIYPARLDLWLKYGKGLKDVNYRSNTQMFGAKASIPLVEREIQCCLKFLPQHRDLTRFEIRLPQSTPKTVESLLEFQRYPPSLRLFALDQQNAGDLNDLNNDRMATAFARLKSLESLALVGKSMLKVALVLLGKVPSLLNIKTLNVQQGGVLGSGSLLDLNDCQSFKNLQHLKIGSIAEDKALAKLTNPPRLESLDIAAKVGVQGLGLISQFVSLFSKSLKSLELEVRHTYESESEEKVQSLFSKVSELEMLTSFKFKVDQDYSSKIVNLSPEILENLKGLFLKPVKLESFEWKVPGISGPGILFDLFKLLEGSCLTLRNLNILHPIIDMEKPQKVWLLNFLQRLESIEVLHLSGFNITEEAFWVDLVDSLKEMKLLRSLKIEYVTSNAREEWLIKSVITMLKKKGLEMLRIGTSFLGVAEKGTLNLKEIIKTNPALKEVSDNIRELFNTTGLE